MQLLFGFLLSVISLFLILLVLVQRGRGGGLTGALGGMGGQSAFGSKAGDTFTRITIIAASVWILCAILAVKTLGNKGVGPLGNPDAPAETIVPGGGGADGTGAGGTGLGGLTAPPAGGAGSTTPAGSTPAGSTIPQAGTTGGIGAGPADGGTTAEAEPTGE